MQKPGDAKRCFVSIGVAFLGESSARPPLVFPNAYGDDRGKAQAIPGGRHDCAISSGTSLRRHNLACSSISRAGASARRLLRQSQNRGRILVLCGRTDGALGGASEGFRRALSRCENHDRRRLFKCPRQEDRRAACRRQARSRRRYPANRRRFRALEKRRPPGDVQARRLRQDGCRHSRMPAAPTGRQW